jgi:hypothetical protein
MDQYVPPLIAVTGGAVIVFLCFTLRIPFFLVGLLSVIMVLYTFQDHIIQFGYQYSSETAPAFFKDNASIFITLLVIILSLGFLLFKFGPKAMTTNEKMSFGQVQQKSSPGLFDGFFKMFQNPSSGQATQPARYDRSRSYNDYGRSSSYNYV